MMDHVTIPVGDLALSKAFYERALAPLGFGISFGEEGLFWAFDVKDGLFEISQAAKEPAPGPVHIALRVADRDQVRAFHDAALAAGATDNGAPGPRPQYTENYYACFVLDQDGNNIEAMHDA